MEDSNRETFILKMGRFTFKSTQPGKETRKTVVWVGVITLFVLLTTVLLVHFLKIGLVSVALVAGGKILTNNSTKKQRRE